MGDDYLNVTDGSISLSLAITSVEVTFALVDDTVVEDTENLQALLSFSDELEANISLSPSVATVTIIDNDNGGMSLHEPQFIVLISRHLCSVHADSGN